MVQKLDGIVFNSNLKTLDNLIHQSQGMQQLLTLIMHLTEIWHLKLTYTSSRVQANVYRYCALILHVTPTPTLTLSTLKTPSGVVVLKAGFAVLSDDRIRLKCLSLRCSDSSHSGCIWGWVGDILSLMIEWQRLRPPREPNESHELFPTKLQVFSLPPTLRPWNPQQNSNGAAQYAQEQMRLRS